jgi:hypothetical protein
MHIKRIQLDDVFDAPSRRGAFSFRSEGRTTYGVHLPGLRVPAAGSTLVLAFERPDDWRSVTAWRDLATQRVTLRDPAWAVALAVLGDAWLVAPLVLAGGLLLGGFVGLGIALAACAGAVGGLAWRALQRNRRVRAALLAAQAN